MSLGLILSSVFKLNGIPQRTGKEKSQMSVLALVLCPNFFSVGVLDTQNFLLFFFFVNIH